MQKTETDVQMMKSSREANQQATIEDDDREYYKQEVGEEPDKGKHKTFYLNFILLFLLFLDLFSSKSAGVKRKFEGSHFRNKKMKLENGEKRTPQSFSHNKGKKKTFDKDNKFKDNKFRGDKKIKGKGKGVDKTNSYNRDHRPIGGKIVKKKFKGRNKK